MSVMAIYQQLFAFNCLFLAAAGDFLRTPDRNPSCVRRERMLSLLGCTVEDPPTCVAKEVELDTTQTVACCADCGFPDVPSNCSGASKPNVEGDQPDERFDSNQSRSHRCNGFWPESDLANQALGELQRSFSRA